MTGGETRDLASKQVKLRAAFHSRTKAWKVTLGRLSRRWSYLVIVLIRSNWRSLMLPVRGILSCVQLWQTFEFLQGWEKLHDLSRRTSRRGGSCFSFVACLGRWLRKRRIEEGMQRRRQIVRKREIEGGEEKVGNPLKYVLKRLCQAQTGNWRIHQPAPERQLCNQSLPSSIRQLPDPTGGQLGREGRMEGSERESEVGENSLCGQKHQWWLPVERTWRQKGRKPEGGYRF